jgi:hypothetical protein
VTPARKSPSALTPQERRRRKARRAWIPTIVIGAIILLAIGTAVLFQAEGVFTVPTAAGNSKFNIAGVKVINGAADVRIDVRKSLPARSVGLPATGTTKVGPFNDIQLEVDLVGTSGEKRLFVDAMAVETRGGQVRTISTDTRGFGFLFIRTQLASLDVLGLTDSQLANFENAMPNGAGDADSFFSLGYGTGNALGVPTAVTVSCAGAKGCTVETKTTLLTK